MSNSQHSGRILRIMKFQTKKTAIPAGGKNRGFRVFLSLLLSFVLLTGTAGACFGAAPDSASASEAAEPTGGSELSIDIDTLTDTSGKDGSPAEFQNLLSGGLNYSAIMYDYASGLPSSDATDIAETSEGFLWIGSYSGLMRYDGNSFAYLDPSTGITSVKCLHVDSRGRLWIGTNDSGVALLEDGTLQFWNTEDGLGSDSVRAIVEDSSGVLYFATTRGLSVFEPDGTLYSLDDPITQEVFIRGLWMTEDDLLYGLTNAGDIFTVQYGRLTAFYRHEDFKNDSVNSLFPDPNNPGYVYIETDDSVVAYGRLAEHFEVEERFDISPLTSVNCFAYLNGNLWIGARNGIGIKTENGFHSLEKLPLHNAVEHVITDYDGNLWFTSSRQGIMKIVPNRFTDLFSRYDLSEKVVNTTCLYQDQLFVGTDSGLIVLDEEGVVPSVPLTSAKTASGHSLAATDLLDLLEDVRIRSIIRDSQDRLWISTWRTEGLLCYDHGNLRKYTTKDGLLSDYVRVVYETGEDRFLVAVSGGVHVIENDRITATYGQNEGLDNPEILTVCESPNGDILCGSDGDGIYIIGEDGVQHRGTEEGLQSGVVMRIKPDPKRHLFWIVTGNSLAYMDEDYQVKTLDQFPFTNNFDLYENKKDELWVLSSNGLYTLPTEELLSGVPITPVHYSVENGLPCIATANSYSALSEDGLLYIAGNTGVARVNIDAAYQSVSELKAAIPFIDADNDQLYPDENGNFHVPSHVKKIVIQAFVYTYSLITPHISYRLDGFDEEDVPVDRDDLDSISYTNLAGGTYRFHLQLEDPLTHVSKEISVGIVKEKSFHEHAWFYVVLVLAALALLHLITHRYIQKKMKALEEKNREEAERARISTELHMANRIQTSMLPGTFPAFPDRHEFDIYASMTPAKEVGGDFYDFFLIDDDHLCMVIADVSGKGIPAALFMMISKVIVRSCARLGKSPEEILEKTNTGLSSGNTTEMFVTVWLGILEISTGKLTAANAGHEYPVLRQGGGPFALYKDKHGFVIGGMPDMKYKEYEIQLQPGDKLFLYTDGVTEAADSALELFGTDRLTDALNTDPDASPETILMNVRKAVDDFVKEAEQFDDLTMLCLEYKGTT